MTLEFSPVICDEIRIRQYVELLTQSFPNSESRFTKEYLQWLYSENPDGSVVGFDAWDGERLAAHYACIPIAAKLPGENTIRALVSLNTATHPKYQGQGLFTKLATITYEAAAIDGYAVVIGVANANSTPGFIRKLGFQKVCQLDALIGIGSLRFIPERVQETATDFVRVWSRDALIWRLCNPCSPVTTVRVRQGLRAFFARTTIPGLIAWTERPETEQLPVPSTDRTACFRCHVFVGITPYGSSNKALYVRIPEALKPSPLTFIYRPLNRDAPKTIDSRKIFFDFLDFDAF